MFGYFLITVTGSSHRTSNKIFLQSIYISILSVVSTSRKNVNVALVLAFLYKIVEVFGEYLKDVEEESIRDNFVVIYELLDEMMDFGYPQTTEGKILQE